MSWIGTSLFFLDAKEKSHYHQTVPFISLSPVNDYVATLDQQAAAGIAAQSFEPLVVHRFCPVSDIGPSRQGEISG